MVMEAGAPRRPYAAAANITGVIARARTRNLPEVVDNNFLRIAGVPEAVYGRVLFALQFLDLIRGDGSPTDRLRAIAAAPEQEYRDLLAAALRDAYRADFVNVNPAEDEQGRIIDAFRPYEPRSQTSRMVMLFLGLCRAAGIPVRDAPRERQQQRPPGRAAQVQSRRRVERSTGGGNGAGAPANPPGLLFGVSLDDIANLNPEEFKAVWEALGIVTLARARAVKPEVGQPDSDADEEEEPEQ